jgi:hypothetical protein
VLIYFLSETSADRPLSRIGSLDKLTTRHIGDELESRESSIRLIESQRANVYLATEGGIDSKDRTDYSRQMG